MAEGEAEWELCKENIQPLRQGRDISALHQALSQHQDGSSYPVVQQHKQAFESELRLYNGDDPLDVWDRYIKWTQQTYPQGGKESNLSVLLERAVMLFVDEKKYHNDIRYVNLWIKFADNSTEPLDFYTYMNGQGIGVMQAAFYIAWSEEFEKHGNYKKADAVYLEGIRCGAEPCDKLQLYHKSFQARVSRQVVSNMTGEGQEQDSPEPAQPHRSSLVDLKFRGKKKAIVPINRTGASVSHHPRSLNLQLPAATPNVQNSQVMVFDENQAAGPSEPRREQWMAPPMARAKENELMPEKWTNVKMPQKSRFGHSVVVPPSKPNFQPYVEESDEPPVVTPCKINPAVNSVLSARKPSKEENPLERLQEPQQQVAGQTQEQSMYCKELLYSGATEFCFEELRAERVRKKTVQELQEKESEFRRVKEELRRQIEEKQRLLLEKSQETDAGHQAQHYVAESDAMDCLPGPSSSMAQGRTNSSRICPPSVYMDIDTADATPRVEMIQMDETESKAAPFTIFNESVTCEQQQELAPVVMSKPSARKPLNVILKSQGDVPAAGPPPECGGLEGIEPLNEDAIIGSYRNKTLCHIPDDTCDFARAAQLASTPFSGGSSHRAYPSMESGLTEDLCAVALSTLKDVPTPTHPLSEAALRVKKLSPIQEGSLEDGFYSRSSASSSSPSGASCMRAPAMNLSSNLELRCSEVAQAHEANTPETEMEDPTSVDVRKPALAKINLSSIPNLYKNLGPLPSVNEHDVLSLGDETLLILSGIINSESYTVHFGQTKSSENAIVKVDHHPIPWDFYINTHLRSQLGPDSHKYFREQSRCFLYEDGCITVSWGHYQGTLRECLATLTLHRNVPALVIELLELVEQMHSCHLVHGDLCPDTLLLRHREYCEPVESVLRAVDFSQCLDLDLQPEVTSVLGHPGAQAYLKQGVLSSSSSPYQIDLLAIAETVHVMLEKRSMQLVCNDSEWDLAEDLEVASGNHDHVWRSFFKKILNPGRQTSVSILSELQQHMRKHFSQSIEIKPGFIHEHCHLNGS